MLENLIVILNLKVLMYCNKKEAENCSQCLLIAVKSCIFSFRFHGLYERFILHCLKMTPSRLSFSPLWIPYPRHSTSGLWCHLLRHKCLKQNGNFCLNTARCLTPRLACRSRYNVALHEKIVPHAIIKILIKWEVHFHVQQIYRHDNVGCNGVSWRRCFVKW